jgi:hypothetical protein
VESTTDGHCRLCGLHHHRRAGSVGWQHVIGPLTVTLSGLADIEQEAVDADELRFAGRYMTIEVLRDDARLIVTVPATRLVRIVARD